MAVKSGWMQTRKVGKCVCLIVVIFRRAPSQDIRGLGDWILESLVNPWKEGSLASIGKVVWNTLAWFGARLKSDMLLQVPLGKLPFGRSSWEVNSRTCDISSDDGATQLSLTSCKKNEFTCDTGKCISLDFRLG